MRSHFVKIVIIVGTVSTSSGVYAGPLSLVTDSQFVARSFGMHAQAGNLDVSSFSTELPPAGKISVLASGTNGFDDSATGFAAAIATVDEGGFFYAAWSATVADGLAALSSVAIRQFYRLDPGPGQEIGDTERWYLHLVNAPGNTGTLIDARLRNVSGTVDLANLGVLGLGDHTVAIDLTIGDIVQSSFLLNANAGPFGKPRIDAILALSPSPTPPDPPEIMGIPEPTTLTLAVIGLISLLVFRRRTG